MPRTNIFDMKLNKIYPLLRDKVTNKNRSEDELKTVIYWMLGYDEVTLNNQFNNDVTYKEFFENAPKLNPNCKLITGTICKIKVEEIEDPLLQKIRWLDKLVDELAKGKSMEKILRS